MSNLFVSYRYWHKRDREWRNTYTVIPPAALAHTGVTSVVTLEDLEAIRALLLQAVNSYGEDVCILSWRRMEEVE